jgi:hypothetical protein
MSWKNVQFHFFLSFIALLTAVISAQGVEAQRGCTIYQNGEKTESGDCLPEEEQDFYVKSRGVRIKRNPEAKESPYEAVQAQCEKQKNGLFCLYLGLYLEERWQRPKATRYFSLGCKFGNPEACDRKRLK